MRTTPIRHDRTMTRMLASIVTWALIAGQVMQPVYAVLTTLGDIPVAAKVCAKPNIVYTLDDSGSMSLNYVPGFRGGHRAGRGESPRSRAWAPWRRSSRGQRRRCSLAST